MTQSSFDTTRGSGHRPRVTGVYSGGDGTLLHSGDFEGAYKVHILLWGDLDTRKAIAETKHTREESWCQLEPIGRAVFVSTIIVTVQHSNRSSLRVTVSPQREVRS